MKFQLESDFAKHVKGAELQRVYLLYGEQDYLIELYQKQLVKKALDGDFNDFNLHQFAGSNFNLQEFYDSVESLPMFAGGRCVTLDADLDRLDAATIKELCEVLTDPPATTTVVVTVKNSEGKKDKLNQLIKVCDKAGSVVDLGARNRSDTLRFLRNRAQKNGCELSSDVASYLLERCTDDLQLLSIETDKLCAYAGTGVLTCEDVDEVVAPVLQARVFDLSKAILGGRFPKAMELIDQLCGLREPMPRVLAVLSGAFIDLYRGYAARQAAVSSSQAAIDLGYPKNREFAIKNAMQSGSRYSPRQLGQMLEILADADKNLKSTGLDDRILLEQTVTRLFLIAGET